MAFTAASEVDNRDAQEMYAYLEARIETMKRRIAELERENNILRSEAPRNQIDCLRAAQLDIFR